MDWLEFFFGWLIKGQYEISLLDSMMFWLECIVVFIIGMFIYVKISSIRENKKHER